MTTTDAAVGTAVRFGARDVAERLGLPVPTPEQVAVIEAPLEPVLVVAGAGSGKTETMTARVVHLIVNGLVEPERVLGLTFTRKAAGELGVRVRARLRALRAAGLLDPGESEGRSPLVGPTISTYNSYAAGLVSDHAMRLGIEPASRLLGEAARWQHAAEVVEQWAEDLETDYAATSVTTHVLDLAGAMAEHLVDAADVRAELEALVDAVDATPVGEAKAAPRRNVAAVRGSLALRTRLVDLVAALTERKRTGDLIDFADQVAIAARLAREVPEVGEAERARYGVVLLDEYQDTSVAQLALLSHLFGGDSGGPGHAVTAVGDPHQSIYGWRGASAGGLERFPGQFPAVREGVRVDAAVLSLSTSWRNDTEILRAANTVAEPLRAGSVVELPVLGARPGAGAGEVVTAMHATLEDEVRAIAEFVAERRATLEQTRPDGGPVTSAVLCRKRSQFLAVEAALRARGLPVEVVGLGGLLTTPEVVDLVAALQAVHDPSRGDALMRLLTGPRLRLGLRDVMALGDWAEELARRDGVARRDAGTAQGDVVDDRSIVDALDHLPAPGWRSRHGRELTDAARERLVDLATVLRSLRGQTYLPVVDLVAQAERLLGLDIEVVVPGGRSPASARAALDAFREVAAAFDGAADVATLGAFLAWLAAAEKEERGLEAPVGEMDPAAVQVLTVHAAKGLEWDVVAVAGMVEGTFPDANRGSGWVKDHGALPASLRGDRDWLPDVDLTGAADVAELDDRLEEFKAADRRHGLQEERRLAYVALTRARGHLMLSGSWWRDGKRPVQPSTFLTEVAALGPGTQDWAPDPTAPAEDGAVPTLVKPEPPETEAPTWPLPAPLGDERHRRIRASADAVRAAMGRPAPASGASAGRLGDLEAVVELLLAEQERGTVARRTVALPPHLSASAMVRLAEDPEAFTRQLRRPVPSAPSVHARRGTAFHAWLEQWFGRAALVDVDQLPGADDDSAVADPELEILQRTFLASEWAERTPIAVEVDVETPVGAVVVRSRIDAVFTEPDGRVVVVDWKTGRPPTDRVAREAREVQLALYRLAWARRTGRPVEEVDAAFYYVGANTTVRPVSLLDAAGLEALVRSGGSGA